MNPKKHLIVDRLVDLGLDPSLKGFDYVVDMLLLDEDPEHGQCYMYTRVAPSGVKWPSVEHCVRSLITNYYNNHEPHRLLRPSAKSGSLPNMSFVSRLRVICKQDSGRTKDGRFWYVRPSNGQAYEIHVFADNGTHYLAFTGPRNECVKYIERELI